MSAETKIIDLMRLEGKTRERIVAEAVALLEDYYSLQRAGGYLLECWPAKDDKRVTGFYIEEEK
jgi:hypothetical protein